LTHFCLYFGTAGVYEYAYDTHTIRSLTFDVI
jgi:hypothetical protein